MGNRAGTEKKVNIKLSWGIPERSPGAVEIIERPPPHIEGLGTTADPSRRGAQRISTNPQDLLLTTIINIKERNLTG
jgi:hypothetical protein